MTNLKLWAATAITLALAGCGQADKGTVDEQPVAQDGASACPQAGADGVIEIQEGLTAKITRKGYGRAAVSNDYADVHTTLWLYDETAEGGRGTEVWSSGGVNPFPRLWGSWQAAGAAKRNAPVRNRISKAYYARVNR
jgi:hypothetical protein